MEIKDDHFYPIKDAVILTGIKHRTLTRKASKMGARVIDGRYLLTGKQVKLLIEKQQEKLVTLDKIAKIDKKALDKLVKNEGNNEALKLEIKLLKAKLDKINKHVIVMESFFLSSKHRIEIKNNTFKLKNDAEKKEFLKEHMNFWMKAAKGSSETLKNEMDSFVP